MRSRNCLAMDSTTQVGNCCPRSALNQHVPDEAFWDEQLSNAIALRRDILKLDAVTDSYRVIHAEADGFPGLVIDRYAMCSAPKCSAWPWGCEAQAILERLAAITQHPALADSAQPTIGQSRRLNLHTVSSPDLPAAVTIPNTGTRYRIHFGSGT